MPQDYPYSLEDIKLGTGIKVIYSLKHGSRNSLESLNALLADSENVIKGTIYNVEHAVQEKQL